MARITSLPAHIPILPLYDQAVLFPGLLLRLHITTVSSTALLTHILRSDQATLVSLVLGCVPVRPGKGISEIIGAEGNVRPALPPPSEKVQHDNNVRPPVTEVEFGCTARIKSLSRLDRSYGTTGFVLVVEGIYCSVLYLDVNIRNLSVPNR